MLRIALLFSCAILLYAQEARDFTPLPGWDNQAVTRVYPKDSGGAVIIGMSHKKATPPSSARSTFALWVAEIDLQGDARVITEVALSPNVVVSDLNFFDNAFLQTGRDKFSLLLPTGDENLYEIQSLSLETLKSDKQPDVTKVRVRLPKGFAFGHGGKGSGGMFSATGGKIIVVGLGLDGRSIVALSGSSVDKLEECFRYQAQSQLDIVGCFEGALVWENGDLDQFGGGSRKLEGALIGIDKAPRPIGLGKFASINRFKDGFTMLLDRSKIFPQAEYAVYFLTNKLDWADTTVLGTSPLATPFSARFVPASKGKTLVSIVDSKNGIVNLYELLAGAKEPSLRYRLPIKDVDAIKGLSPGKDNQNYVVINARSIQRDGNRVTGISYVIRLLSVD